MKSGLRSPFQPPHSGDLLLTILRLWVGPQHFAVHRNGRLHVRRLLGRHAVDVDWAVKAEQQAARAARGTATAPMFSAMR